MSKLSKKLAKIDFIRRGLCKNYWLWAHVLFAVILARVFSIFLSNIFTFFIILSLMIVFEIVEFIFEGIEPYGSGDDWYYDTLGDIIFPLLVISIMLF